MNKNWFELEELPNNVYAIKEPYHFQEIISYFIIGSKGALLLDTGMGIRNIREVTDKLYDGEPIVINSHTHFDHIGGNHLFDEVMVFNNTEAINRLKRGYTTAELVPHNKPRLYSNGYFEQFAPKEYLIAVSKPKPIEDGHIIDLGNRQIKVIHTPGHSPDSIMLLDMEMKALFTGDSYYPGHLYAHYEGNFYGESNIKTYAKSMEEIALLANNLKSIHPGHNQPSAEPKILEKVARALRALADGMITDKTHLYGDLSIASLPDSGEEVEGYVIPDDLYVYDFEGIKIIAKDPA
jgi:glyoxylase-like metal-dependent hydrolase (beta-lactamase superfamily II)